MVNISNVADLTNPSEPQGRTYRQVNAEKTPAIPIGTLVELETGERLRKVDVDPDLVRITLLPLLRPLSAYESVNSNMRIQEWIIPKDCLAAVEAAARNIAEKQTYENIVSKLQLQFGRGDYLRPVVDYVEYLKNKLDYAE